MISCPEDILDVLVVNSRDNFEYSEDDKTIKDFYQKAFAEDRFVYLYKDNSCIGYLIFYLFDKNGIEFMFKKKDGFDFPEHKKNGKYLYIEYCVIFKQFKDNFNLLHLREVFAKTFPQIRNVCWHKSRGTEKRLFNLSYSAERKL